MSTTYFKAAYTVDVTEFRDNLKEKLSEWNILVDDEESGGGDCIFLEKPFALVSDNINTALQIVMKDEEHGDGAHMAFTPERANVILERLQEDHKELLKYILSGGFCRLYPITYTWHTSSDEPVVL